MGVVEAPRACSLSRPLGAAATQASGGPWGRGASAAEDLGWRRGLRGGLWGGGACVEEVSGGGGGHRGGL